MVEKAGRSFRVKRGGCINARKMLLSREVTNMFFGLTDSINFEHKDISSLREDIDDSELLQALKYREESVFTYATDGTRNVYRYRSSELFDGLKATKLYTDMVEGSGTCWDETPEAMALSVHFNELWMTSDMKFHWVVCVAT